MQVGFATADITPGIGIYLTGYGMPERLAESIHSPLKATVMLLKEGECEAAVIGMDWCFVDWDLTQDIRRAIFEAAGVPEKNILLCCSHTHSAPHTTYMRTLGRVAVDPENKGIEYVKQVTPAIAEAVCRAKASLRETVASFAAGKTETGVSRRGMDKNGNVAGFIADPFAVYDSNMTAVRFKDAETREDLGILIHCSAHNTAMGADRNISSDWCGVMKKRIGHYYNVPVVFTNGAIGDVGPRTNRWMAFSKECFGYSAGGGDGVSSAEEVGYRAASDALRLLENMRDYRSDLPLKTNTVTITLPQEPPISEEDARKIIAQYDSRVEKEAEPPLDYQLAKIALETWKQPPQPEFKFEQTVVAFGPLAFAPFPFEMFSVFSLRLRKYGPFQYTLLTSNTNGRNAYMPDRGAIACGGYEVTCRETIRPYVLKPEAGDLAVAQTFKSLESIS
ncbi:MAG: neutral/alkaline non-lysosomal ceramidase N-terminal domain-containing protein [Lentisphaeria bacterium]|nr:neutral/alkaline non-lysosomal ceramidase N-terminal domain-containing protein [Lentisphaeria bacterium]